MIISSILVPILFSSSSLSSPTPSPPSSSWSSSSSGCPTRKESFSLRANVLHLRAAAQCCRRLPPPAPEDQQAIIWMNVLLKDKDKSKKSLKKRKTWLMYVLCRQTQQVELPLYYNAYRAPNQQVAEFFSRPRACLCRLIVLCLCPFVSSFIACKGVLIWWYQGMPCCNFKT